jgi:microcystin-dependent protein
MSQPFLGEIKMFGGNFAPRNYALCNGQVMSIAQNTALFSILGTTYGGNGVQTFALPNMQGRVPMHWGSGAGLSTYVVGESGGTENVTLLQTQMPSHTHLVNATTAAGIASSPASALLASPSDSQGGQVTEYATGNPNTTLAPTSIAATGGSQPHANIQPFLCVSFIIALQGIFPSRN